MGVVFFFKDFIYLFMRNTEREAETQAEGEAGSLRGARCGTQSQVSRITPWTEGGAKLLSHRGCLEHLPLVQVMVLGSWDQVLHRAPLREPASPSVYVLASLCVSHESINQSINH